MPCLNVPDCGRQTSITAGTILHRSKLPLQTPAHVAAADAAVPIAASAAESGAGGRWGIEGWVVVRFLSGRVSVPALYADAGERRQFGGGLLIR